MKDIAAKAPTKRERSERVQLAAIGMEAEFAVLLDGKQVKPEDVFRSPRNIVREEMMHRTGRSYHLPTGGAIYFDTGVIEVATPIIEIRRGCAARADLTRPNADATSTSGSAMASTPATARASSATAA